MVCLSGCTLLAEAPELPAESLDISCYKNMFMSCTSLTEAPELPATTLYKSCYENMFSDCTSLTDGPELPAPTLEERCYAGMLSGCTLLSSMNVSFTNWGSWSSDSKRGTYYWLKNVSKTGEFTKPSNLQKKTGPHSIPTNSGWKVIDK